MRRSVWIWALSTAWLVAGNAQAEPGALTRELELVRVERVNTATLTAGSVLPLRVVIANRGSLSATVAAAVSTQDGKQGVVRSASASIAAGATKTFSVNVPITPRAVRREQFKAHVIIADPSKPATANILEQLFRDGNVADNAKDVIYPVRVDLYDVSITLKKIVVNNDCNPGGNAKWKFGFTTGHLDAADAGASNTPYWQRASFLPRPSSTLYWPTSGYKEVSTGQSFTLLQTLNRFGSVPKRRYLAIHASGYLEVPPFEYMSNKVGWINITLPPDAWNFGTIFRKMPEQIDKTGLNSSQLPHDKCGDHPYLLEFQITTAPTVVI
jgi:hypothetical protein